MTTANPTAVPPASTVPPATGPTINHDAPSDGSSLDAAPEGVPEFTALALAKLRLMESAREIQPLKPLREHPWTTVGVAAGAGAVLGSTGGAALAFSSVFRSLAAVVASLTRLVGPLASIIGPIVAGKVAGDSAGQAAGEAAAEHVEAATGVPPEATAAASDAV